MQYLNPGKSQAELQAIWNGMSLGDQGAVVGDYEDAKLKALTPKLPPYDPNAALGEYLKDKERMGGGNGGGGGSH